MKLSKNLNTGAMTSAVSDHLTVVDSVYAVPRLTIDWNMNRYSAPTADNTPSEDTDAFDDETFPISSLFAPNRPTKGICKAIVGQSTAAGNYKNPTDVKFYVGDQEDVYKYWVSPYPTNGSGVFPNHTDGFSTARPRVEYPSAMPINKIIVKFETTWATPSAYTIQTKSTPGGGYVDRATNPVPNNLGVVTLYYNGSAWSTTRPATLVTTMVAGIQLHVTTMTGGKDRAGNATKYTKVNRTGVGAPLGTITTSTTNGANSNLSVIAIEPHYEVDFTDRLISESSTFDMSETSAIYPIGTLTSNVGSIMLENDDRALDEENASSPYYGLLKQNAEVNLEYIYTISGVQHSVQQFEMYTSLWAPNDDGTVSVDLEDYSKFFDSDKPRAFVWENVPVTQIIWRICDSVGFIDYAIQLNDQVTDHTIPVFWSDGTQTVWQLFDELARASQTAIYFDATGTLQVRTREAAYAESTSPNVHLMGRDASGRVANIISLGQSNELHANKITVSYRDTKWKVGTSGLPALSEVWSPGDTLTVRSTQLKSNINNSSTTFNMNQKDAETWPYQSKVQIDGEIISYDAKEYLYFTGSGTPNTAWVQSQDDIAKYNLKSLANNIYRNHVTGKFRIKERGLWNSDQRNHQVDANGWNSWQIVNGNVGTNPRGFNFNRANSTVTINTPGNMKDAGDLFLAYQGSTSQTGYYMYGTRMKFNSGGGTTQRAGIAFQITGSNNNGYYVEITPTNKITAKERKNTNEVTIWSRTASGWKKIADGHPISVRVPRWYDVDVYVKRGSQDQIQVWLNGVLAASGTTTATTRQSDSAKLAMFARGKSEVTYEYFYAIARNINEPPDDFGFYDLKEGGIRGDAWELQHVWNNTGLWRKRHKKNSTKKKALYNGYLFDEFGPYIHEVREFNVKFDPAPVQYSYLFSTNTWEAAAVEYNADNFTADFVITNISRENAILQGDDNSVFAGDNPVNQVCVVLGRDLVVADDQTVIKRNEGAIRADGEIESELASDFIQSEEMATDLAVWMSQHWSSGIDQMNVTVFGNPCYELGDIVDIDWPAQNMNTYSHVYFVVGVNTSWDNGVTTELTLRRRFITPESSLT